MGARKKRIGLLLASLHTGSAVNMWKSLVRETSHSGSAFYVFPGGRLNGQKDGEYLRNGIYSLANKENLDGIISWGSSLGGVVSKEELDDFHKTLSPIPYATISHKMPSHPCVRFDAYNGMAELVRHFVEVHHATKIAFLKGPTEHYSSMERFKAFCDVMKQDVGVDMTDSPLVSEPFAWSEGDAAAKQLYEERGLVPGKDFEVLIASSDMMAFAAVRYLNQFGYEVPEDYACAGFNDSAESRIMGFSTVHMPCKGLGLSAFSMIKEVLSGERQGDADILLPAHVILRESCGCNFYTKENVSGENIPKNVVALKKRLGELFNVDDSWQDAVIEPVINALLIQNTELVFSLLEKALDRFFENDLDIRTLYSALEILRQTPVFPEGWIASLEERFLLSAIRVQNKVIEMSRYKERQIMKEMNSLKCEFLSARDRLALCRVLAARLPRVNINSGALVLTDAESDSTFVGGFFGNVLYETEKKIPRNKLLPDGIEGFDNGVYVVQPLFIENQYIGYFVCSAPPHPGAFFEELRSAISSSLGGVFLFEQSTMAEKMAEQAEQAKTLFFANVGSDLAEPLAVIANKIDQVQKLVDEGCDDTEILSDQLVFLKSLVQEQLNKTNQVVELTLSQTSQLKLDKTLFHIEDSLRKWENGFAMPLLYGDKDKVSEAFSIYCKVLNIKTQSLVLKKTDRGLSVTSSSPVSFPKTESNEIQLSKNILFLHGASVSESEAGFEVLFPWPKFSCDNASSGAEIFEWNADEAEGDDFVNIYSKRNVSAFCDSAFLCTCSMEDDDLKKAKTFAGLFEKFMSNSVSKPVLFVGSFETLPKWIEESMVVSAQTMEEAELIMEKTPLSLVVLDRMNCEAVEKIRNTNATVLCPVFVLPEKIEDSEAVNRLSLIPRVILCNRYIAMTEDFAIRARAVLAGNEILPPDTGALVKKAICYLNVNTGSQIYRWKLADEMHASEDYLTRIFHKEMGLSPWEYLNLYRVYTAAEMLLHTNATVQEVAENCGFHTQAYFCRVFRKIYGIPPGKYRSKKNS